MSDVLDKFTAQNEEHLSFYNGEVQLAYDKALHAYYEIIDGEKFLVPPCTTIIGVIDKPALVQWASNATVACVRKSLEEYAVGPQDDSKLVSYWMEPEQLDKLLNDARFNYRKISQTAKDIGHIAHAWLEDHIKALIAGTITLDTPLEGMAPLPEDEKAANCVKLALDWQKKHNLRPFFSERKLFSRKLGVAGTADWGAYIDTCDDPTCCPVAGLKNVKVLGDYKSSKALYEEYRIQAAFYQYAYEEEFPDEPGFDMRVILRIGKEDVEFETMVLHTSEQFSDDMNAFEGCLAVYTWKKQLDLDSKAEKMAAKAAAKALKPAKKPSTRRLKVKEVATYGGDIPEAA